MSVHWTIEVPDDVAEKVAAVAAERGVAPEALVGEDVVERYATRRRKLSFVGIGESVSGRTAADADEMLAEGFGRD